MTTPQPLLTQRVADLRRDASRCIALAVHATSSPIRREMIDEAIRLVQRSRGIPAE
jgi:hypothetical protein